MDTRKKIKGRGFGTSNTDQEERYSHSANFEAISESMEGEPVKCMLVSQS